MDILTERAEVVQRIINLTTGSDIEKIKVMIDKLHRVADVLELENQGISLYIPPVLLHAKNSEKSLHN